MEKFNQPSEPKENGEGTKRGLVHTKRKNWVTAGIVAVIIAFIIIIALTY